MLTLGIIDNKKSNEQLKLQFQAEPYCLTNIKTKKQLAQLNGLIVSMDMKEDLSQVIEWIIACQKVPTVFIWVFSKVLLDYEENILLELGVNDVIMTEKRQPVLTKVVKNTFKRLEEPFLLEPESPPKLLNEKNQSIQVNGKEQGLTRKEFQLMRLLCENQNTTVTYEQLMYQLWPETEKVDILRLANIVFHIRNKSKESDVFTIKTVRSKGYMLAMK
ncbi:hypothetical protein IGJ55_002754 [Enterococcus sp. AZ170]|uniref:helix-turn-helix domain-containing protein n=1 Tax=unclassified Enterococcus TaxID=2608891 RepID=UPI003D2D1104